MRLQIIYGGSLDDQPHNTCFATAQFVQQLALKKGCLGVKLDISFTLRHHIKILRKKINTLRRYVEATCGLKMGRKNTTNSNPISNIDSSNILHKNSEYTMHRDPVS